LIAEQQAQLAKLAAGEAAISVRSCTMWLMLWRWLAEIDTGEQLSAMSLAQFAGSTLLRYQGKLRERCVAVKGSGKNSQHRLRIAAKSLRYATEFFRSFFPQKESRRLIGRLVKLQDAFGLSNDAEVAIRLMHGMEQSHPELKDCVTGLQKVLRSAADARQRELFRLAHRFAELKMLRR
jgi:CHAD domain-containing protein